MAGGAGGGVRAADTYLNDNPVRVRNSIIAGNGGYGVYRDDASDPATELANNDVYNNTVGDYYQCTPDANSISADARFVGAGDYHLAVGSPCRDAGAIGLGLTVDLEGNARPFNARDDGFDQGCYEHEAPPRGTIVVIR